MLRPTLLSIGALVWALNVTGCERGEEAAQPTGSSAAPAAPPPESPAQRPQADEQAHVPVGAFMAGSKPGDPGRQPELEPRLQQVRLGPFRIDRLPYPNDPNQPPLLGKSRDEAARLCGERGARLCSELEWERACKGAASNPYPGGTSFRKECGKGPTGCASGFDVLGLGTILEWTSSDVIPPKGFTEPRGPVVRGAGQDTPGEERRCARRTTFSENQADSVGFRCCHGAPNGAKVKEPGQGDTFEKVELKTADLKKLLEQDERTSELAKDVVLFREPEAAQTVIDRGPGDKKGFSFTVAPLLWNPTRGARFLVVAGRSGERTSFVVAYHVVSDDEHRLAASFVMKNEVGPIAFAYSDYIRPRFHFSSCWGCPGDTGKVLFRDPEEVAILQP